MPTRLQIAELLADATNVALLRLLRDDPRLSVSELARRVKMSAPAVRERLQRLEEAGIVRWRIDIDPRALGFPICAYRARAAGAGTIAEDRGAGAAHAAGHRVPPRHRRGLLRR